MANKTVTTIPAKKKKYDGATRAAIYCRVSSPKKEQLKSLVAQVSGLTNLIAYLPGYVLFDTYIDIASGSTIEGRPEFQRLLSDCQSGKIKYVLTKSASRFSRDVLVAIAAVRQINLAGAKVHFIEEAIDSDNQDLEVHLAAHLAVAEMENHSRSENIQWGIKARAAQGIAKIYNKICYGYQHDKDGKLVINEAEAENVRYIFRLYLDGYSINGIIQKLKTKRIKSPTGKDAWNKHALEKMLCNVKYAGDASIETDEGTYLYTDHHPAIISRDAFNAVQAQKAMRSNIVENPDGTVSRKHTKYSGKRVVQETMDQEQLLYDLNVDPDIIEVWKEKQI